MMYPVPSKTMQWQHLPLGEILSAVGDLYRAFGVALMLTQQASSRLTSLERGWRTRRSGAVM